MIVYLRLCKLGYAQSVREAESLDARTVLQAFHYENFLADYERVYMQLNK